MWGFFLLCTVSAQIMCDYCFACNTYGAKQHRGRKVLQVLRVQVVHLLK